MSNNPEVASSTVQSPETQEVVDSTRSSVSALQEEITTTSGIKSELSSSFKWFFDKLKSVWDELKEWNISKAVSILFSKEWQTSQSQQQSETSSTTRSTWSSTSTETTWTESQEREPSDTEVVSIKKYISDIKYDLKYATSDNNFWVKAYSDWESNLKLEYDAVKKLSKAQEILKKQWYQLKIWDAYRPTDAQQKLYDNYKWPVSTKSSNIAKPWTSHHWTWKAVDLTLVDMNWNEVEMPTWFDDFSWKATRNSVNKLPKNNPKRKNAYILRDAMEQAWFYTISSEWWHYQIDAPRSRAPRW